MVDNLSQFSILLIFHSPKQVPYDSKNRTTNDNEYDYLSKLIRSKGKHNNENKVWGTYNQRQEWHKKNDN